MGFNSAFKGFGRRRWNITGEGWDYSKTTADRQGYNMHRCDVTFRNTAFCPHSV